jgi:hypothetical protein
MSNDFKSKLGYGKYGESIVVDYFKKMDFDVFWHMERYDYDMEVCARDIASYIVEVKAKRSMDLYTDETGFDFADWLLYQTYDQQNFLIYFVDWRRGVIYGDSVANLKKHAFEKYCDSRKKNKFKLITFKIDKIPIITELTQSQITKLKDLQDAEIYLKKQIEKEREEAFKQIFDL